MLLLARPLLRPASSPSFRALSTSSPLVTVSDLGDGIRHVLLNNPAKHNSLSMPMFDAICTAASDLSEDRAVRAVVLSGAGKSFCTGLDVKGVASNPSNMSRLLRRGAGTAVTNVAQDVGYLWRTCPFPTIAAVHGKCFGGGLQIAMGCDLRFSSPGCEWSILEAKWGLIPDMSATVTFREHMRMDDLKELAMTGRVIGAEEARGKGLVTRVVEDPLEEAVKVAREIAARSPDSVALTKKLFQDAWVMGDKEALQLETDLQKSILPSKNQAIAVGKNFGVDVGFFQRSV
ncbi:hypothetical protein TeGR_g2319 [Tetraparma gracilis]|uniref:Uncharacterized protein n=1 Tax=Tetraparma gracilis TaxID=2962635 RepID=A0ABQ6MPP4_9STRA|nr:hypothetical protein TeGR_g2319 [Tetraparma gracilis]